MPAPSSLTACHRSSAPTRRDFAAALGTRLGRHRWQVESTIAWLFGYRRPTLRYERHPELFCAFLTLGAALTCYHRLTA